MIKINEIIDLTKRLEKLNEHSTANFGKMTPQHMVEHLIFSLRFSNGKMPQKLMLDESTSKNIKEFVINTDKELPIGFKAPMLTDELLNIYFPNLDSAKKQLEKEISEFYEYAEQNPSQKPINPTMGELDFEEWNKFHNKHITHHFNQFGI
jgi:hypothetical protein